MNEDVQESCQRRVVRAGMACALVCLAVGSIADVQWWFAFAAVFLVIAMVVPALLGPAAMILGHLGSILFRLLLVIVFFVVVTPLALLRRMLGHDPMSLRGWRKNGSAFVVRDHMYSAEDMERPS